MAKYAVYVFCDECGEVHPMRIAVELHDGPTSKQSVGDTYQGRELPPKVAKLVNNQLKCPQTGALIAQRNNDQVFLVPM